MQSDRDRDLAELEEALSLLEQHARHVVGLLGRRVMDTAERVAALQESTRLFEAIKQIQSKVHELRASDRH